MLDYKQLDKKFDEILNSISYDEIRNWDKFDQFRLSIEQFDEICFKEPFNSPTVINEFNWKFKELPEKCGERNFALAA